LACVAFDCFEAVDVASVNEGHRFTRASSTTSAAYAVDIVFGVVGEGRS
jgi:hypothetical protein